MPVTTNSFNTKLLCRHLAFVASCDARMTRHAAKLKYRSGYRWFVSAALLDEDGIVRHRPGQT